MDQEEIGLELTDECVFPLCGRLTTRGLVRQHQGFGALRVRVNPSR
jgi:hypothetical protein